MYLTTQLTGIL